MSDIGERRFLPCPAEAEGWRTYFTSMLVGAVLVVWAVALVGGAGETHGNPSGYEFVTSGSTFRLRHVPSPCRLHSHDVKYGSRGGGSGQQTVTGFDQTTDSNSLWKVLPATGAAPVLPGRHITTTGESTDMRTDMRLYPIGQARRWRAIAWSGCSMCAQRQCCTATAASARRCPTSRRLARSATVKTKTLVGARGLVSGRATIQGLNMPALLLRRRLGCAVRAPWRQSLAAGCARASPAQGHGVVSLPRQRGWCGVESSAWHTALTPPPPRNQRRYQRPIPGQREVCAVGSPSINTSWMAAEGIFIKQRAD